MYRIYHCIQKPTSPSILIFSKSSAAKQGQYFSALIDISAGVGAFVI